MLVSASVVSSKADCETSFVSSTGRADCETSTSDPAPDGVWALRGGAVLVSAPVVISKTDVSMGSMLQASSFKLQAGSTRMQSRDQAQGARSSRVRDRRAWVLACRLSVSLCSTPSACPPMALPRYTEVCRLSDRLGHFKGVTALSFSADGSYLASAGLDNRVCIWDPHAQKLLHSVEVSVGVYSLDWAQNGEDLLVCGLGDGTLVSLFLTPVRTAM